MNHIIEEISDNKSSYVKWKKDCSEWEKKRRSSGFMYVCNLKDVLESNFLANFKKISSCTNVNFLFVGVKNNIVT